MKNSIVKKITAGLLVLCLVVGVVYLLKEVSGQETTYDEFLYNMSVGKYEKITINGYYALKAEYKTETEYGTTKTVVAMVNIPNREIFREDYRRTLLAMSGELERLEATYDANPTENNRTAYQEYKAIYDKVSNPTLVTYGSMNTTNVWEYVMYGGFIIASIFLVMYLFRQVGKQNQQGMMFAKSRARVYSQVGVRFTDVAGCDEEKEELEEIIDFLKNPKQYDQIGARIPKGVLLVGPPGTGKTLLAKAVAGEAGVPFFSISGSDFVEMYVGVGASRVRDLFDEAKRKLPCIIFIDEIDAVGRQRGAGLGGGHDEREQTLNQILVEMDGFETNVGIIIMAATNRHDILDPALLRPGRFDRQVFVSAPDVKGREAILRVHARNKQFTKEVDFKTVAKITVGFTGADLENLLNEAAIHAVRHGRLKINMSDINEACNKVTMGPAKKSRIISDKDKRITAYHEAGHAIVAKLTPHYPEVHQVTIIPRGNYGGFTSFRLENDQMHLSKSMLLGKIAVGLGGRVAEELILESVTTGASGDIKDTTAFVHKMVAEWGMSEAVGPVFFGSEGEVFVGRTYQNKVTYSEEMAGLIDREESRLIKEGYQQAKQLLTENINILHNFARTLLEVETIGAESINKLMEGVDPKTVIEDELRQNDSIMKTNTSEAIEQNFPNVKPQN